jgi:hypothetical protein
MTGRKGSSAGSGVDEDPPRTVHAGDRRRKGRTRRRIRMVGSWVELWSSIGRRLGVGGAPGNPGPVTETAQAADRSVDAIGGIRTAAKELEAAMEGLVV